MLPPLAVFIATAALIGCSARPRSLGGTILHATGDYAGTQPADASFRTWPLQMKTSFHVGGSGALVEQFPVTFYVKLFERDKKLGVCGGYSVAAAGQRGMQIFAAALAAKDSYLQVDDAEAKEPVRFWPGFFTGNRSARAEDVTTACAITPLMWKPEYEQAKAFVHLGRSYS